MDFNSIQSIKDNGFVGFKTMKELFSDTSSIPGVKGVYLILNLEEKSPNFLLSGTGGFFKGKNPNVSILELENNWVDKSLVVYIGKAGSGGSRASLKSRLKQYFGFGQGRNIGHYGGRLIWQLASSENLVVCWKSLPKDDPRTIEAEYIIKFKNQFGIRPFANLVD